MSQNEPTKNEIKTQEGFNNYISNYNAEFILFLHEIASESLSLRSLISTGRNLKDIHEFIIFIQKATDLKFEIIPYPFTFSHGREYFSQLGFNDSEIDNIHNFLQSFKQTAEQDFEKKIEEERVSARKDKYETE